MRARACSSDVATAQICSFVGHIGAHVFKAARARPRETPVESIAPHLSFPVVRRALQVCCYSSRRMRSLIGNPPPDRQGKADAMDMCR